MCELLGMSANVPTDICFSFTGLMQRGGGTGPHRDGWGIVFYEGKGIREFLDPEPSVKSEIAKLVRSYPIKSTLVISHIRQANSGRVCLENTHPFVREMWGRYWSFAHNGQLKGIKKQKLGGYQPVGSTDSEHAFCWLLHQVQKKYKTMPRPNKDYWQFLKSLCDSLKEMGVCNLLFSDGKYLMAYCSTHLHWITRCAPFGTAQLKDAELSVDFRTKTKPSDSVTVIATKPLTCNEQWTQLDSGELSVFHLGKQVALIRD